MTSSRKPSGPKLDEGDNGVAAHWEAPDFDDSAWQTMPVPGTWEVSGVPGFEAFDGLVWFRRAATIPPAWEGKDLTLRICAADDSDATYFNGTRVGRTSGNWTDPRTYAVPGNLVKAGKAVITVRIMDCAFAGGFAGSADEMSLCAASAPVSEAIPLAGDWRCRRSDLKQWPNGPGFPTPPQPPGARTMDFAAMLNGMAAPIAPFAMRGVIWYQGESNAHEAELYAQLLPVMIREWRAAWQQKAMPFGIVQLANFQPDQPDQPAPGGWALLREAQEQTVRTVPQTGLAVAVDIGEAANIHPINKQELGRRLALWATAQVYGGEKIEFSGPIYRGMKKDGDKIVIEFGHVGAGLETSDGAEPGGFAVAGDDGKFVWAHAKIDGNRVIVWSEQVAKPAAVRYAWANNPAKANLRNKDGLPASPFRTDMVVPGRP